jgi:hypothetical protein
MLILFKRILISKGCFCKTNDSSAVRFLIGKTFAKQKSKYGKRDVWRRDKRNGTEVVVWTVFLEKMPEEGDDKTR